MGSRQGGGGIFFVGEINPPPLDENPNENLISILDENLIRVLVGGGGGGEGG